MLPYIAAPWIRHGLYYIIYSLYTTNYINIILLYIIYHILNHIYILHHLFGSSWTIHPAFRWISAPEVSLVETPTWTPNRWVFQGAPRTAAQTRTGCARPSGNAWDLKVMWRTYPYKWWFNHYQWWFYGGLMVIKWDLLSGKHTKSYWKWP